MSLKFFLTSLAIKLWNWSSYTRFLGEFLGIETCEVTRQAEEFWKFGLLGSNIVGTSFNGFSIETVYCPLLSGNGCLQNVCYIYNDQLIGSKVFFFWERENGCFFFTCVVWTTVHHIALKNHRMYILLQQWFNLICNITTLLRWCISCLNQTYLISTTTLLWTYIHKNNITRNEKILQWKKTGVLLFMNNVPIIMYNTSMYYLNGLIIIIIIIIIFFQ